jgi:hypothetical protein
MRGGEVARTFLRSRASLAGDLARLPGTHSLPGVDAARRQELRANLLDVAEEPHFIIASRLVARRNVLRTTYPIRK